MLYYRYRPISEVSLKELLYNEMYFSSPDECNDPFDSKTFFVFNSDKEKWSRLVQFVVDQDKISIPEILVNSISEHICNQCPLTFDEAINRNLFSGITTNSQTENLLIKYLSLRIQQILIVYKPSTRYFVSFSIKNSDPLMWSHYADKHKGFCLIFKAINGAINQSPNQKKRSIRRTTTKGIAPDMSYDFPDSFELVKIDYKPEVKPLNAFLQLPVSVSGDAKNEAERLKIFTEKESHYFQKSKNWEYESEYRLILKPPIPWLFGEHFDYSKQERLFHYDPSQLVGIIYGSRMELSQRNRIIEILKERKVGYIYPATHKRIFFDFMVFEAKISSNQREVEIAPIALINHKTYYVQDKDFPRLYKDWQDGWGIEMEGNHSKKIKVD